MGSDKQVTQEAEPGPQVPGKEAKEMEILGYFAIVFLVLLYHEID